MAARALLDTNILIALLDAHRLVTLATETE